MPLFWITCSIRRLLRALFIRRRRSKCWKSEGDDADDDDGNTDENDSDVSNCRVRSPSSTWVLLLLSLLYFLSSLSPVMMLSLCASWFTMYQSMTNTVQEYRCKINVTIGCEGTCPTNKNTAAIPNPITRQLVEHLNQYICSFRSVITVVVVVVVLLMLSSLFSAGWYRNVGDLPSS